MRHSEVATWYIRGNLEKKLTAFHDTGKSWLIYSELGKSLSRASTTPLSNISPHASKYANVPCHGSGTSGFSVETENCKLHIPCRLSASCTASTAL